MVSDLAGYFGDVGNLAGFDWSSVDYFEIPRNL